jgi:hypothetical protein
MHSTIPGSSTLSSTVYTHIPSLIGWTPKVGGNAGGVNQYREIGVAFRSGFFWDDEAVVGFIADYIANQTTGTSAGSVGIKGVSSYQLRPPDQNNQAFRVRVGVPRNQQRASELYIELDMGTAGNHFQIQNMSVTLNQVSEKQGRR